MALQNKPEYILMEGRQEPSGFNLLFNLSTLGKAVKPLSLVAPVLGNSQWAVPVSFIFPPA